MIVHMFIYIWIKQTADSIKECGQNIKKGESMEEISIQHKHTPDCIEQCDYIHVHSDIIDAVNSEMPAEELLYDLADFYKVFADSTRIKILYVLMKSEMCVCDIAQVLNASQSAVSHQLRVLKQMQLVKFRREGKTIFYSLSDDHISGILSMGLEHIKE